MTAWRPAQAQLGGLQCNRLRACLRIWASGEVWHSAGQEILLSLSRLALKLAIAPAAIASVLKADLAGAIANFGAKRLKENKISWPAECYTSPDAHILRKTLNVLHTVLLLDVLVEATWPIVGQ